MQNVKIFSHNCLPDCELRPDYLWRPTVASVLSCSRRRSSQPSTPATGGSRRATAGAGIARRVFVASARDPDSGVRRLVNRDRKGKDNPATVTFIRAQYQKGEEQGKCFGELPYKARFVGRDGWGRDFYAPDEE